MTQSNNNTTKQPIKLTQISHPINKSNNVKHVGQPKQTTNQANNQSLKRSVNQSTKQPLKRAI